MLKLYKNIILLLDEILIDAVTIYNTSRKKLSPEIQKANLTKYSS